MTSPPVGTLLRSWRQRRRLSQLDLSNEAGVSARHLSFVETGRSQPSREMVLHLAESLEVPLRARNELLVAAGFAPVYGRRGLDAPDMAAVRRAIDTVLAAYEPFPAVVVDRGWSLVAGNRGVPLLTDGVDPRLLEAAVNVLRLSLPPDGMAPRIRNLAQWRAHVLHRLDHQALATHDPFLRSLHDELLALPGGLATAQPAGMVVPLRYAADGRELSFFSVTSVLGTPLDVTL